MPVVEKVLSGSVVYYSGSGTDPANINVGAHATYPLERSLLMFTNDSATNLGRIQSNTWLGELVESGANLEIDFSRSSTTGAQYMTLEWQVVVFASAALAQDIVRGVKSVTVDPTDIPIDAVATMDEDVTMVVFSAKHNTSSHWETSCSWTHSLEGTSGAKTDLRLDYTVNPTDNLDNVGYQVVEFANTSDIYIQHGVTNSTTTGGYENELATLSGFTTLADMFVMKAMQYGSQLTYPEWSVQCKVNSTTELELNACADGTPATFGCSWQVVEILDGGIVETGEASFAVTSYDATASFTALTEDMTSVMSGNAQAYNCFMTDTGQSNKPGTVFISIDLDADEAGITLTRRRNEDAVEVNWAVVDWTVPAAGGTTPKGPFTLPFCGTFRGPI